MISSMFGNLYKNIEDNIYTMTGNDLYRYKEEFYEECLKYKGDTLQMTGISELLVGMYLKALNEAHGINLDLKSNVSKVGRNNKSNEVDFAFLNEAGKIIYGISVKNASGKITFKDWENEVDSEIINKYQKPMTIVQDLFRLHNIKIGEHGTFKSVTIIFSDIKTKSHIIKMKEILKDHSDNHSYIILENNDKLLFNELGDKLGYLSEKKL